MTTRKRQHPSVEHEAREAAMLCVELRQELRRLGVALPALTPMAGNRAIRSRENPASLIWLGTCDATTGERLLDVLRRCPVHEPTVGSCVVDTRDGRVGRVLAHVDRHVQLGSLNGGRRWDCPMDAARPASQWELKNADLCEEHRGFWRNQR